MAYLEHNSTIVRRVDGEDRVVPGGIVVHMTRNRRCRSPHNLRREHVRQNRDMEMKLAEGVLQRRSGRVGKRAVTRGTCRQGYRHLHLEKHTHDKITAKVRKQRSTDRHTHTCKYGLKPPPGSLGTPYKITCVISRVAGGGNGNSRS